MVPGDAFVAQVNWLVAVTGGKEQLAQRSGGLVSVRTLDNWTAGNYPRTKVTGAVRELDMWARTQLPGYPTAAGVPSLIESCGPASRNGGPVVADEVIRPVPDEPTAPPSRRWRRWALMAAAQLSVIGAAVLVTLLVVDEEESAAAPDGTAAANELVNLPLPSTGDGRLRQEEAGSIGANTYADPRTLEGGGPAIPPNTVLEVRCRYYAPSVPSVTPDGFWYLIETAEWNGLWSPANSFMNGDVPGGPYIHNTDFDVPVCE
ncbi:hypothetical protein DQ239_18610 [Blastococcus sp. TF02-09]|nr:hypothetical protein DQ239_18610 [Blastococcus sp. TF02-9]